MLDQLGEPEDRAVPGDLLAVGDAVLDVRDRGLLVGVVGLGDGGGCRAEQKRERGGGQGGEAHDQLNGP